MTTLANLVAGAAVTATDLFYGVQTVGAGGRKITAAQLKTFMSDTPTLVTPTLGAALATSVQFTDITVGRAAADILAISSTSTTALRVFNVNGANSEYAELGFKDTANTLTLTTRQTGSGVARSITISSAAAIFLQANGAAGPFWSINTAGALRPGTNNTLDIGDTTVRIRDIWVGRDIYFAGGSQAMLRSISAVTSGGAAQAGTLSNAPVAGNPTKWIPFNDAGTTRYIPAW